MNSLILFAQRPDDAGVLAFLVAWIGVVIGVVLCVLVIWLAVAAVFCLSMSNALNQVSESNRQMSPGMVWGFMVPGLHIIWYFLIVLWVPDSLKKEFEDRDMDDGSTYGKTIGLTSAIMMGVNFLLCCIPFVNYCSWVIGVAGIVLFIIFWVQVAGYAGKLASRK